MQYKPETTSATSGTVDQLIAATLATAAAVLGEALFNPAKVFVTFFQDEYATTLTTDELTLADLAERIQCASAREKSRLPWLKLARFGKQRSDAGSLRHDANVDEISGIEIDYDIEEVSFERVIAALKTIRIEALVYTSASHTPDKPRWRVLCPTSKHLPPQRRAVLVKRLNGYLKVALGVEQVAKSESFALSQSYFFGWVCDAPKPHHGAAVVYGDYVDLRDDLESFEASGDYAAPENKPPPTFTGINWDAVTPWLTSAADLPPTGFSAKGRMIIMHSGSLPDLNFDLDQAGLATKNTHTGESKSYESWSHVTFALASIFKADGRFSVEQIAAALMANLPCNAHITRQKTEAERRRAVERAIARSYMPLPKVKGGGLNWRECYKDGSPMPSMYNARLAINTLNIGCAYDSFHNKLLFGFKGDPIKHALRQFVGEVTDNGIVTLRQLMSETFGFDLTEKHVRDAVISLAMEHCFDPVVEMLAAAEAGWDGIERLDRMAVDYLNCEDTTLNRACVRKTMIAAVARARHPGIKKDEILVLESEEGYNKSTAWRVLAGDENFSDESIIGKNSREVQEHLASVWIHENADLAGMRKAEVETVKTFASRQEDRARPAYGYFLIKQKRHSIEVGTTNADTYLLSQTGNRRFWPMQVLKPIDIEKLKQDRLQLWGEAAYYQSRGESLVLDEALWGEAAIEQEARRVTDPWEDILRNMPEVTSYSYFRDGEQHQGTRTINYRDYAGKLDRVVAAHLLEYVLGVQPSHQTTQHSMRLATVMKKLGWQRAKNGYVTIGSIGRVMGYFRYW
jgi:predicted P-loop ATPase